MEMYHSLHEIPKDKKLVLAIGFFDGCHKGHQVVFEKVRELAAEKGAIPGVLTFFPHPMTVLAPHIRVPLLQSEEEKMISLAAAGMELAVFIRPDQKFLSESAETFMTNLSSLGNLSGLVAGENFTFGKGARGNSSGMAEFFKETKVTVDIVKLVEGKGAPYSSTRIREAVLSGNMEEAARLLGRNYSMQGDVVHGFRRGHEVLGFPTANLSFREDRVLPPDGVYATRAIVSGRKYDAITNIGTNPTFGNTERTIETFIFHFEESIYGKPFTLEWVSRLRGEKKFESFDELKKQIAVDIKQAEIVLGKS